VGLAESTREEKIIPASPKERDKKINDSKEKARKSEAERERERDRKRARERKRDEREM
jgi:hypothetical protein